MAYQERQKTRNIKEEKFYTGKKEDPMRSSNKRPKLTWRVWKGIYQKVAFKFLKRVGISQTSKSGTEAERRFNKYLSNFRNFCKQFNYISLIQRK